jgi:hypothetical protein
VMQGDAGVKSASLAQRLAQEHSLPNIKLEANRQHEDLRRALRDLAVDGLRKQILFAEGLGREGREGDARGKAKETTGKSREARRLFFGLRPRLASGFDLGRKNEDRSGHAREN